MLKSLENTIIAVFTVFNGSLSFSQCYKCNVCVTKFEVRSVLTLLLTFYVKYMYGCFIAISFILTGDTIQPISSEPMTSHYGLQNVMILKMFTSWKGTVLTKIKICMPGYSNGNKWNWKTISCTFCQNSIMGFWLVYCIVIEKFHTKHCHGNFLISPVKL